MPTTAATEPEIYPWNPRDPARFLERLARLMPLTPSTIVALVHRPSTRQELLAAVRIDWSEVVPTRSPDQELDRMARSDLLHDVANQLWGDRADRRDRPAHAFVTVVIRPGRVVFGSSEFDVLDAWRFANYAPPVFGGELLLVTEHGWRAFADDSGGATPAMEPAPSEDDDPDEKASWDA